MENVLVLVQYEFNRIIGKSENQMLGKMTRLSGLLAK